MGTVANHAINSLMASKKPDDLLTDRNRSPPSRSNCDRNREVMQVRSGAGESVGDV